MKFLWKKHVVSSFVTVLALFSVSYTGIAPVGAADHGGQLVGEAPRRDVPVVLDGDVRAHAQIGDRIFVGCLLYTSPSPRDGLLSRMPSSA